MANYYTELSTQFDLPDPDHREWAIKLADGLDNQESESTEITELIGVFTREQDDWFDGGNITEEKHGSPDDHGIWIHTDESCNPEHVAWFIQAIMIKFNIKEPFIFEWAYTCSKPRLDSFGGGACMVTQEECCFFLPRDYAEEAKKNYVEHQS